MARSRGVAKLYGLTAIGVVLILPAYLWVKADAAARAESIKNFKLVYHMPVGWVAIPHAPQMIFSWRDPKTNVVLKGSQNQVESEVNPSPDLDRDGLVNQFADITVNHLGWKAQILDTIDCKGGSFRLIRRTSTDRTIVSGIAVKGNTTILITLAAIGKAQKNVDLDVPTMRKFLAESELQYVVLD